MFDVLLIGISLSMDAFAVTVTNAITMRPFRTRDELWSAVYFGFFQFLMPLLGGLLAGTFSGHVSRFGPYISFVLLGFIGIKMICDAVQGGDAEQGGSALTHSRLLALAVATSIDAMAVGVSFAFSPPEPGIWLSCILIGCTTFLLTLAAAALGKRVRIRRPQRAGIIGGAVLLALGVKLLLEGIL